MLKDHELLNPALASALARAGHGQLVVIADAGLPIPDGPELIDLSLVPGTPSFLLTGRTLVQSLHVESVIVAEESLSGPAAPLIQEIAADLPRQTVSHHGLKELLSHARVVVRTGECTPFANLVLVAGTSF
jgi:D-ribose pyranase